MNKTELSIGVNTSKWMEAKRPLRTTIEGTYCKVEPFSIDQHAGELYQAFSSDKKGDNWTYMRYGPFRNEQEFRKWASDNCLTNDPIFYVVIDKTTGKAVGLISYLNINVKFGTIEIGHLNYSPFLQRTVAATEAMYLMMKNAIKSLGYRRYQWQCDSLNVPSRNAALRLGFSFEGVLRQATIYKNRNRDSAYFSIIDKEWPLLEVAYEAWLNKDNFDANGLQKSKLSFIIENLKSDL